MTESHPGDETAPVFTPRILKILDDGDPPLGLTPLRLVLLPSGVAIELTRPELTIGRHSSCDVRLPLPDVSRRHCRLLFQAGRWWLLDHHSLNGIYVNDTKVDCHALQAGDRVRIGGFTFVVAPAGSSEVAAGEEVVLQSIATALADPPVEQRRAS